MHITLIPSVAAYLSTVFTRLLATTPYLTLFTQHIRISLLILGSSGATRSQAQKIVERAVGAGLRRKRKAECAFGKETRVEGVERRVKRVKGP